MYLGHVEIFVADMARARRFYEEVLGFELTVAQSESLVWLRKASVEILLRLGHPPAPAMRYEDAAVGFVLYASGAGSLVSELERRGLEVRGTVDSSKCFTFTDPDGNWFQLVDPDDLGATS